MATVNLSIPSVAAQSAFLRRSPPKQYSNLRSYNDRIVASDRRNFIKANGDLIDFINQDSDLKAILQERKVSERDDLKDVIVSGALEKLDSGSPVTRKFLEENFNFAKFVSINMGNIADALNNDAELAKTIVKDGDFVGGALLNHIADKVASSLGSTSPITGKFLNAHPEAAIHLLESPYDLSRVKTDRVAAKRFVDEIGRNSAAYNSEIAAKAKDLLKMPTHFSTDFLEKDARFAQLVVASELSGEDLKLAGYLRANTDLSLRDFSTSDLVEAYQADLAENRFQGDFPLVRGFFLKNKAIAAAVVASDKLVSNLKKEGSMLENFFGPRRSSTDAAKEGGDIVAKTYQSSSDIGEAQYVTIDLFA